LDKSRKLSGSGVCSETRNNFRLYEQNQRAHWALCQAEFYVNMSGQQDECVGPAYALIENEVSLCLCK